MAFFFQVKIPFATQPAKAAHLPTFLLWSVSNIHVWVLSVTEFRQWIFFLPLQTVCHIRNCTGVQMMHSFHWGNSLAGIQADSFSSFTEAPLMSCTCSFIMWPIKTSTVKNGHAVCTRPTPNKLRSSVCLFSQQTVDILTAATLLFPHCLVCFQTLLPGIILEYRKVSRQPKDAQT